MLKTKILKGFFFSLLFLIATLNVNLVYAEPHYYVRISTLKDYYLKGETVNIHVTTNSSVYQLQIYLPNNKLWVNKSYMANITLLTELTL